VTGGSIGYFLIPPSIKLTNTKLQKCIYLLIMSLLDECYTRNASCAQLWYLLFLSGVEFR